MKTTPFLRITFASSDPPQNKTVVNVSCGMHHTAALLDNGNCYLWGAGECDAPHPSRRVCLAAADACSCSA